MSIDRRTPPTHDFRQVHAAKARAEEARHRALLSVSEGLLTVWDVLREAAGPDGKHLLKLRLARVLEAQPGWSRSRADKVVRHAASLESLALPTRREVSATRVSWVVDARAGARRWLALADAIKVANDPGPAWPGFPYAPPPKLPPIPGVNDD